MKINKSSALLLAASILMIVCAGWNVIWRILKLVFLLTGKAQEVVSADYDFSILADTSITKTGLSVLNSFLIGVTAFLQVVSGIAGLIYSGFMLCAKRLKFIGIPSILGSVTLLMGLLSALTLGFSESNIILAVMWLSLFVVSLLYVIFSFSFLKGAPAVKEEL